MAATMWFGSWDGATSPLCGWLGISSKSSSSGTALHKHEQKTPLDWQVKIQTIPICTLTQKLLFILCMLVWEGVSRTNHVLGRVLLCSAASGLLFHLWAMTNMGTIIKEIQKQPLWVKPYFSMMPLSSSLVCKRIRVNVEKKFFDLSFQFPYPVCTEGRDLWQWRWWRVQSTIQKQHWMRSSC